MSSVGICLVLCMISQWGAPIVQEAELAPPESMAPAASSNDLADVKAVAPAPASTPAPTAPAQATTRWEYDEEGRLVVRTDAPTTASAEKPQEKDKAETPAPKQEAAAPQPPVEKAAPKQASAAGQSGGHTRGAGRVATFWFVLPKE